MNTASKALISGFFKNLRKEQDVLIFFCLNKSLEQRSGKQKPFQEWTSLTLEHKQHQCHQFLATQLVRVPHRNRELMSTCDLHLQTQFSVTCCNHFCLQMVFGQHIAFC